MKLQNHRYKIVLIAVFSIVIVATSALLIHSNADIEYPNFDNQRLFLVRGVSSLVEIPPHSNPYEETIVTKLDIDFYPKSIDSDGDRLYISGGHTFPESLVACGIYLVNPLDGTTELIYDSTGLSKFIIDKIFCVSEDNRAMIVGISSSEVVIIDSESKVVIDKIAFDFSAAIWGSVGDQLIVGFSESENAMYAMDLFGDREFVRFDSVTEMIGIRSSLYLPYSQNGTWYGLQSDLSSTPLDKQWVRENARFAVQYPRTALEDLDGHLMQLVSNEIFWKTYMRYRGKRVGRIDTMVYDLCVLPGS